ncbi:MAG: PhoU domain-containing protein, partial [Pyramidobacter porci]
MRSRFDKQLNQLNNNLLAMGALAEQAIASAAQALSEQDEDAAGRAIELEREIDSQERAVESLCLKLLLEQQPVAGDLRLISAALKMITDLERIGDQAADIAEIILRLRGQAYIKPLIHLP